MPASLGSLPVSRLPTLVLLCALLGPAALVVGCGEGGVAGGATVSVYVTKPLCAAAGGELEKEGKRVGEVRVRIVCLPPVQRHGRADLATAGANARRATEDSTAVAFLEATGPAAKFTESIVQAANIAWLESNDGATAMHRVLKALGDNPSSPRSDVRESLSG
jgi:hypothetical protein